MLQVNTARSVTKAFVTSLSSCEMNSYTTFTYQNQITNAYFECASTYNENE